MFWGEKPYHSLDYEMKQRFGEKVYRLSLNGGMTCPNRDGTAGTGGCIFCSAGGSGDVAAPAILPISAQPKAAAFSAARFAASEACSNMVWNRPSSLVCA